MAWVFEAALPFTPVYPYAIYFSPIIGNEVYVINNGTDFWKYNLSTNVWTELTSPTYDGGDTGNACGATFRVLAVSPDGSTLVCSSEGKFHVGTAGWVTGGGRRIEFYNIAGNSWSASKQTDFTINGSTAYIKSIVWEDDDTLWVWCMGGKRSASDFYGKCVKYVKSTNTWTAYSGNNALGTVAVLSYPNAAIKADLSIVYAGGYGRTYSMYTVATDTYTGWQLVTATDLFIRAYDRDKLWYYEAGGTCQQGYLDSADISENPDQFPENTDRDAGYGRYCGIKDDLSLIIAQAKSTAPELMSGESITTPTVATNPATVLSAIAATPNGTLDDDGGEACQCGFEWGLDTSYGTITATESKTTGETFSQVIGGLTPNTIYHFRAFATNSVGTSYGADRSFTTALVISRAHALAREEL